MSTRLLKIIGIKGDIEMKKLLTIFVAVGLIASMTACGSEKKEETSSTPKATETTEENNINIPNISIPVDDGDVVMEEYTGKTLGELIDNGYKYTGHASSDDHVEILLRGKVANETIEQLQNDIEGLTVAELVDEYDMTFGHSGVDGVYTFYMYIGSVEFSCDLENGVETLKAHDDEMLFDLEEADEVQDKVPENITFSSVSLNVEVDAASATKLLELEDIEKETILEMQDEIVLSKVYFEVE